MSFLQQQQPNQCAHIATLAEAIEAQFTERYIRPLRRGELLRLLKRYSTTFRIQKHRCTDLRSGVVTRKHFAFVSLIKSSLEFNSIEDTLNEIDLSDKVWQVTIYGILILILRNLAFSN